MATKQLEDSSFTVTNNESILSFHEIILNKDSETDSGTHEDLENV